MSGLSKKVMVIIDITQEVQIVLTITKKYYSKSSLNIADRFLELW